MAAMTRWNSRCLKIYDGSRTYRPERRPTAVASARGKRSFCHFFRVTGGSLVLWNAATLLRSPRTTLILSVELTDIRRQKTEAYRDAVMELSRCNSEIGFDKLDGLGSVRRQNSRSQIDGPPCLTALFAVAVPHRASIGCSSGFFS